MNKKIFSLLALLVFSASLKADNILRDGILIGFATCPAIFAPKFSEKVDSSFTIPVGLLFKLGAIYLSKPADFKEAAAKFATSSAIWIISLVAASSINSGNHSHGHGTCNDANCKHEHN